MQTIGLIALWLEIVFMIYGTACLLYEPLFKIDPISKFLVRKFNKHE